MTAIEQNARSIFLAALEQAPDQLPAYLSEACGDNVELRGRVDQLLQAHQQMGSIQAGGASPTVDLTNAEQAGTVIGPYKLIEQIGEGGMGAVWMAQQTEPVKRLVALKLIKAGMDSKQVIARFEAERQALAIMDHPNIAKVFDGGMTEVAASLRDAIPGRGATGLPYFVMELVKGVPITKYCDEHRLTPRQRLELFIPVCQAVQHAHQKGIIHRDLKPSNVLVALYDGKPVPKVIDFGVAKAAGQPLTEQTLVTGFGHIVGTLEYMSPEQAEINQLDIDTRSDIYSLGVLLYELLTGSPPFSRKELEKAGMLEMLRVIREQEPSKPSTKLSTAEGLATLAANRGTEPAKLTKLVRGELDWIVMKALEKDRNRRYETANGFAMDVQRYLADEPVQACPPSTAYRLRKFARRNRVVMVTVSLVATALVAGAGVSTWQAVRATRAEHEANVRRSEAEANHQKARQAIEEYFTLVSENKLLDVPGLQPLRKSLLDSAIHYYQEMLSQHGTDPVALADLALAYLRVARVNYDVGLHDDVLVAIDVGVDAIDRLRREHPDAREQQLRLAGFSKVTRPMWHQTRMPKDLPAAERTLSRFLALWETLAAENPEVEGFQSDLACITALAGDLEGSRGWIGDRARLQRAIALTSRAAAIWDRLGQAHSDIPRFAENLAVTERELLWLFGLTGQTQEADAALDRALSIYDRLAGKYPEVPAYREGFAATLNQKGRRLASAGRTEDARAMQRRAFRLAADLIAEFSVVRTYSDLLMRTINDLRNQSPETQRELMTILSNLIDKHPHNVDLWQARGRTYLAAQQPLPALADLARALELAPHDPTAPWWRYDRSRAFIALHQDQEALDELTKAILQWPDLWDAWAWRGHCYCDLRQWDKAIADCSRSLEMNPDFGDTWHFRGIAFANLKRWDNAIHDQTKAIALDGRKWGYWYQLGLARLNLRQWVEAAANYTKAVELTADNDWMHDQLAWLLATCPEAKVRNPARAVQEATLATSLSPKAGLYWKTLGVAYYRAGDWKAAIEALGKGVELRNGGDRSEWLFLAMAHWKSGAKVEARKWYNRAIAGVANDTNPGEELLRFRAEAEEVLGIKKQP